MKAKGLGILSALTASVCCLGPLVLILIGLGGLGFGAIIGKYHWYFIAGAGVLLGFSWKSYFSEKKACEAKQCTMEGKKMTRNILLLASAAVLTFVGLNVYTYAKSTALESTMKSGAQMTIPVKGMVCMTCEITVKSAVKKLTGIHEVKASAKDQVVRVSYDPAKTSLDEIISAINGTGFKAERPKI